MKKLKLFTAIRLCILLLFFNSCSYLPDEIFIEDEKVQLSENKDYLLLEPKEESAKTGILFIPGGLVDPHAYLESFHPFASELKMKILILKVRSNLAIFNSQQANKVIKEFLDTKWLIGGHSLGGVVATMSIDKNREQYEGLFLLGSYSNADLSEWDQPVFSFLAEFDKITTIEEAEANANLLPEGILIESPEQLDLGDSHGKTIYYTIKGGNHSQFGNYGFQNGDGIATISGEEQKEELYLALSILMKNNGFDL